MRIVFLHSGLLAYQDACQRALAELGNELLVVYPAAMEDAPFENDRFVDYGQACVWEDEPPEPAELVRIVREFDPDVVVMRAWRGASYRAVMRSVEGRALRVMFSSSNWRSSPKQWAGRAAHRWYIKPLFDALHVPGERSEVFGRMLGFRGRDVIRGANSADVALFERGRRTGDELSDRRRFLYSGRLAWHKAIDVLAPAYARYRELVDDPWTLTVAGEGSLIHHFDGMEGVDHRGFVQPAELADLMHQSSCLLFPSHVDFWGVVVHEACAAGLPQIVSDEVGAIPYLLQDGANGWVVEAGDVEDLTSAMVRMHAAGPDRLGEMSDIGRALGRRLSPEIWARHLHEELERRLPTRDEGTSRRT